MELTSPDNPRIKAAMKLRQHKERNATGQFVAEGVREVSRALAAGLEPAAIFLCPTILHPADPVRAGDKIPELARQSVPVYTVPSSLFVKMTYREKPEGILGIFAQPRWRLKDFGPGVRISDLGSRISDLKDKSPASSKSTVSPLQDPKSQIPNPRFFPDLWLIAVGTQKPGNLGAMARSAEAAGATGMLVSDAVVDLFNPNAIRASTGAVFTFPIISAEAGEILAFLAGRHVRIFAATPDGTMPYTQVDLAGPVALVIGPEDTGLDQQWLDAAADGRISIPMQGRSVDSLNASVAAAVLLFEAMRQRTSH